MKAHIPNFITLLNLFSGSIAVIYALEGNMKLTALFLCLGIFFDFFDGLLARKLKVQSELGVQLDSGFSIVKICVNFMGHSSQVYSLYNRLYNLG